MRSLTLLSLVGLLATGCYGSPMAQKSSRAFDEEGARAYVEGFYETQMSSLCNKAVLAEFRYNTDLNNPEAEAEATATNLAYAQFEAAEFTANVSQFPYETFQDPALKRMFKFLNAIGTSALPQAELEQYTKVLSDMNKVYGTAKVCPFNNQNCNLATEGLNLEPELTEILADLKPEAQDALAYYWKVWRDATGLKIRDLYKQYVSLSNQAAVLNGYANMGDYWILNFESDTFRQDLEVLWQTVNEQLYRPFFAYVRYRLREAGFTMGETDPIGAHILGNMWAQTWEYVMPYVTPYPNETVFDISPALRNLTSGAPTQQDKATILFNMANEFFTETGLLDMSEAFGPSAMIVKPADGREVICHASAWDFCDKTDYRIKMCTEINQADFITIHHELGHIQYFKQYKDLLITNREGANEGFHEAIGDVLALSVSSPQHLKTIGLLPEDPTPQSMLNYLMQQALDKVSFLPFGYLIDSYRWKIFSGEIPEDKWEYEWIKMRGEYQGVAPPTTRGESDFDPGAKFHVPGNTPYIRYFVSFILQFQIQKRLCEVAGHTGPLYECDIYRNQAAGQLFTDIMKQGASKPWPQLLQETIGTDKLDPSAIIEYFQPLIDWIRSQEALAGYPTIVNFNADNYYQAT